MIFVLELPTRDGCLSDLRKSRRTETPLSFISLIFVSRCSRHAVVVVSAFDSACAQIRKRISLLLIPLVMFSYAMEAIDLSIFFPRTETHHS